MSDLNLPQEFRELEKIYNSRNTIWMTDAIMRPPGADITLFHRVSDEELNELQNIVLSVGELLTALSNARNEKDKLNDIIQMDEDERVPFYFNLAVTQDKEIERLNAELDTLKARKG